MDTNFVGRLRQTVILRLTIYLCRFVLISGFLGKLRSCVI